MGSTQPRKSILALKSWLFTPATKSDRFARALDAHADALIIDLEDAVEAPKKGNARAAALRYLSQTSADNLPCALRINSPDTRFGLEDLRELLESPAQPNYLILPKCNSSAIICMVDRLLREAKKLSEVVALIESAKGIQALEEIGREAKPIAFIFGAADMAADLGAENAWEPLLWVRSRLVQAAASAGIVSLDSPYFNVVDAEGLMRETKASQSLGFHGKCAIHPAQIATINEVMAPTKEQVAKARQVLVVNRLGVGTLDGEMVDEAVARKARLILERAGITAE